MKKNIELTVSATVSKAIRTLLTNEELDWAKRNRIEKFIERRIIKEDGYIELIEINSKIYGKNILAVKDETNPIKLMKLYNELLVGLETIAK